MNTSQMTKEEWAMAVATKHLKEAQSIARKSILHPIDTVEKCDINSAIERALHFLTEYKDCDRCRSAYNDYIDTGVI